MSFLGLIGILTAPFTLMVASATEPLVLPLPQDTNYIELAAGQVFSSSFSTDVTAAPKLAQGVILPPPTDLPTPLPTPPLDACSATAKPELQAFIINTRSCAVPGDSLTYRIFIRNIGAGLATDITVQNKYPDNTIFVNATRTPDEHDEENRLLIWYEGNLAPGGFLEYTFTVVSGVDSSEDNPLINTVTVEYYDECGAGPYRAVTDHIIDGECGLPEPSYTPLPPGKLPAIICDPSEVGCQQFLPILGRLFSRAQDPANQPRVCSSQSYRGSGECVPNRPQLGARFAAAIADILPGDCRVLEDNIVVSPEYHDAFNRRGELAAFFMRPLFDSGNDFKLLAHENALLGITHKLDARDILKEIHTKHWNKQIGPLTDVLEDRRTTDEIRALITPVNTWLEEWKTETRAAQADLQSRYVAMQNEKRLKFDPIATQAVVNARESITRACGVASDGGLTALLPAVRDAYNEHLTERSRVFNSQAQSWFVDPPQSDPTGCIKEINRFETWEAELLAALAAFDQENPKPLEDYIKSIPLKDWTGFEAGWCIYEKHYGSDNGGKYPSGGDEYTVNQIRVNNWEVALDSPKIVATNCEKEKVFPAAVETSWCESNGYPEVLSEEAQAERARNPDARPPDTRGLDGYNTTIIPGLVVGSSCSGRPGDPWWTADCSCQCGQLLPVVEGRIVPCLLSGAPIVRHDIFVTSAAECLRDQGHGDPFF